MSELLIPEGSRAADKKFREVGRMLDEADAQIVGLVRREVRISAPHPGRILRAGDILSVKVEPEPMASALSSLNLKLVEDVRPETVETDEDAEREKADAIGSRDIHVLELGGLETRRQKRESAGHRWTKS